MKAFVFASLDCVATLSQGREPRVYIQALQVHSFLAIRRTLNDSKRLLSFPWAAWQAFERKRKGI